MARKYKCIVKGVEITLNRIQVGIVRKLVENGGILAPRFVGNRFLEGIPFMEEASPREIYSAPDVFPANYVEYAKEHRISCFLFYINDLAAAKYFLENHLREDRFAQKQRVKAREQKRIAREKLEEEKRKARILSLETHFMLKIETFKRSRSRNIKKFYFENKDF